MEELIMRYITKSMFLAAFRKEWNNLFLQKKAMANKNPWTAKSRREWTKFMLGDIGPIIKMTKHFKDIDPKMEYKKEWYTVDGLLVGGEDLYNSDLHYPNKIYALIEHEIDSNIEEEMWKLIHWRAPLKVIMFYDWAESEKTTAKRKNFLNEKINKLNSMVISVNKYFCEDERTKYLYIIGCRNEKNDTIKWKYCDGLSEKIKSF
jgi:hypothetical protein